MKMKNLLVLFSVFFLFALSGCDFFNQTTTEQTTLQTTAEATTQTTTEAATQTTTEATVTTTISETDVITTESELTLQLTYIYNLAVQADVFDGTYEEWLETVRGPQGEDGREVIFQVSDGYIQWQYTGDTEWTNLIEVSTLTDETGMGILSASINQYGELIITYTDNTEINLGQIYIVHTVQFKDYNGYLINTQSLIYGEDAVAPTDPIREGYTFTGWDVSYENVTSNLTVTAQYEINIYTISFDSNGGNEQDDLNTEYGSTITLPIPVQEGYDFSGWYFDQTVNASQFTNMTEVESNIILYAQWRIGISLVVFEDYNGIIINRQYVLDGESAYQPQNPVREGYIFTGWDNDFSQVTNNLIVTAQYEINIYTVTFDSNGGNEQADINAEYGSHITLPISVRESYDFLGWDDNNVLYTNQIEYMPGRDVHLTALWQIKTFTVVFYDYYGDILKSEVVEYGDSATPPEVTNNIGLYFFAGWSKDYTNIKSDLNIEPNYVEHHTPPVLSGISDVVLVVGATFDNVLGVTANDLEDGDITADIALTGTVDLSTAGDYTITYTVTDSHGETDTATRMIKVLAITLSSPNGFYNYKIATTEIRHTFMAAAEKYLMNNMAAGVPLFANGGFVLYSSRLALPVDSYIPVMGYGTSFSLMTADDSSVLMDDNEFGNVGEYTYRTTISTNPGTFNQWLYDTSADSDLMTVYMDAPYVFHFNADKSGYDLVPSMAASNPTPVGSHVTDTGKEVAQTWRISIADDLEWFYHPDTDISGFATGHEVIDANDFVDTFKLALDLQWYRAVSDGIRRGFLDETTGILNAQEYVDGDATWESVGIKLIDDLTFEFTFINDMSEWNVRYFFSSFVMTPINIELYNSLQDGNLNSYGTDEKTIAYHGPFYVDYYENDKILRYKENPVYHNPDEYFYTGYTFSVIEDSAVIFQEFLAGKLEAVSLPIEEYDTYKDNLRLKQVPGSTTFRIMINGLGTAADQRAAFPNSTWIPEPILANDDFKMAMFFAIDRQKLAEEVLKTSTTNMYYFSDAYLVDPEMGVLYRDTDQGLTVGAGLSPSTHGYNPTAATALYNLALDALITAGDYVDGTAANPTVIQIEFNYFSGSEVQVKMYEYLKTTFEELFISTEHYINVELLGFAKDFPDIYYDYMMVGEFDLSIGGISGSTLDAASFLDTYCSDNRGGFTLNWGIDTSKADIDILYEDNAGWHYESWSFDAITSALNGKVYVINGVEAEELIDLDALIEQIKTQYADTLENEKFLATENLSLITSVEDVSIIWTSNNTNYLENDGTIHSPTYTVGNQTVILTVTVTEGTVTESYSFFVTIKALDKSDAERATEVFIVVTAFPIKEFWTPVDVLKFLIIGKDADDIDYDIVWTSSHPEVIALDGTITQPEGEDVTVTMIATVTINDVAYTKNITFKVEKVTEGTPVATIAAAIALGEDVYVNILGVTVVGQSSNGIYVTDGTDILYIYSPTFAVENGGVYDITGQVILYYNCWEMTGNSSYPLIAIASNEAVSIAPNTVVDSVEDIIPTMIIPTYENPFNYPKFTVTASVYYNEDWGNYSVFLVPKDYDFEAALEYGATHPNGDSIMIYYQSDMDKLKAFHGKTITIDIIMQGWRSDKLVWYAVFFGAIEDTVAPVIFGANDATIYIDANFDPLSGVTAADLNDGVIVLTVDNVTGTVDVDVAGIYEITYTATDLSGNTSSIIRYVTVIE